MPTHNADWHDRQYNNRARVPEAAQLLQRWAQASALTRSRLDCRLDLAYGDLPSERLDLFPPLAGSPSGAPVLVFLHGGYWRSLDKSDHSFVAPAFVQAGAMVVVPNYALCPAVDIDTIALQSARALAWTWRNAAQFGGDPARIVVAGHSAGGHLAAMLLACRWPQLADDLPADLLPAALSLSGLFDLAPLRRTPFLQADLRLAQASVPRLSPALFPPPAGRLTALVGGDESGEFLRQNRLIRERWGAAQVPVCETLPGLNHFTVMHDLVDAHGQAYRHALDALGLPGD